ncbi:hypothetical protein L1049_012398 [Liquidambar formosana]|uniref:Uncharacterized protein n=1 Tax=Liquidambar formosana TaxID=63359 RepID=A0AAP0R338_LIQFO
MASYHDEAAEAKLKLILRVSRRRSSKLRELCEQKLLAANAALNSLSLGLPIRQKRDELSTLDEFNIDHVLREGYNTLERSWSKLNEIKWEQAHGCFLSSCQKKKYDDDDDLVISSPGLSIWKKWVPGQAGTDLTCCLSVIKDIKFDNPNEAVLGASAVLFLVSESIPWERQKIHLHDLLMSLPSGSHLPLLILSGSCKEEVSDLSAIIVNKLGLHQLDKSRMSGFLIVSLVGKQQMEQLDGFFSDERSRDGLQWLSCESPLQAVLQYVKTRKLVLTHLNSSLKVLDETSIYEVGPNHCISAFNESLNRSLGEVAEAASANPASWPCPEIALLEEFSDEHRAAELYLPSIGWSSSEKIEPLKCALRDCKLPTFPDDISWLSIGSNFG